MSKMNIRKDDTVIVLSGDDKGVTGKVISVSPSERKVIVEGVNIIHKHVKPRRQGETGGIIDAEGAIDADKVAVVCPKCGKACRVGHKKVADKNGKMKTVRFAAGKKHEACGNPEL
jgi:large subunit ribosomal protein L24